MKLRCASFNVLADAWLENSDCRHVARELLLPGARTLHLLKLIESLKADVVGLQEVEPHLVAALEKTGNWQVPSFWSQKEGGEPDGCLMLVRPGIVAKNRITRAYSDGSNHIMQSMVIGGVVFANTHIKFPEIDDPNHSGIAQTRELLEWLSQGKRAVILADCNDRPGGPVRALLQKEGYTNVCGNEPTALIDQKPAALDVIAVRGVRAQRIKTAFHPEGIPTVDCPSDHIPVMAHIEMD